MKVYFDNAATTPIHPKVLEAILPYYKDNFGNPSSIHSYGRKVKVAVEEARETVAEFINADPGEIYFVSGGTEAVNFPLFGIAKTEFEENGKDHIITCKVEHHAVLASYSELEKLGFDVTMVNACNDGMVDIQQLKKSITPSTSMLSLMHVNNELGTITDLENISKLFSTSGIYFHCDAVQSFGKMPINVKDLCIDSISASGHKIYAPKGIGMTWVKAGTPISPMHLGGSQERNRRGGTENVPGIIGFAEAVKIAKKEMPYYNDYIASLRKHFISGIETIDKNIIINGGISVSPYILSITFNSEYYNNDAESMLIYLDINGIAASNGAACSSGTLKPSHVMLNTGKSVNDANGTIRFSFNPNNNLKEVDYTLEILKKMSIKFRK